MKIDRWFAVGLVIIIGAIASRLLAGVGEPQSVWLWREILGFNL